MLTGSGIGGEVVCPVDVPVNHVFFHRSCENALRHCGTVPNTLRVVGSADARLTIVMTKHRFELLAKLVPWMWNGRLPDGGETTVLTDGHLKSR